jgi:hypothetical protein
MMKSKLYKSLILILTVAVCAVCFAACGGGSNNKPAFAKVVADYEAIANKRSDMTVDFAVNFRSMLNTDLVLTVGQQVEVARIRNNGRTVLDGRANSSNNAQINALINLIRLVPNLNVPDAIIAYLRGDDFIAGVLDADGAGGYRVAWDVVGRDEAPTYGFREAFTDDDIAHVAVSHDFTLPEGLRVSDHLMTSAFFDFTLPNFITKDAAGTKFNKGENAFLYNITLSGEVLKQNILAQIDANISIADEETYAEEHAIYHKWRDTVAAWFTVRDITITAKADRGGRLLSMDTDIFVGLNINTAQLEALLKDVPQINDNQIDMVLMGFIFIFGGTTNGWLTIDFNCKISEAFSYAPELLSFAKYDALFA